MISTLGEDLRNLDILKTAGIPAVINGEYVEQHPLGRAEWIKFTGAMLGKWDEAAEIFAGIKADYENASRLVKEDLSCQTFGYGRGYVQRHLVCARS
jgi:iron complex transport system substrate-binding protein